MFAGNAFKKGDVVKMLEPDVRILENLFNISFLESEKTILKSGAEEPIYLPATETKGLNEIRSTHDYFRSALHEISHWCIAGKERRNLVDFGYWYEPDGRTEEQQRLFEQVEIKPQALEWIFSEAAGISFRLSVDNVNNPECVASEAFKANVHRQAHLYLTEGLPERARVFVLSLTNYFKTDLCEERFSIKRLS